MNKVAKGFFAIGTLFVLLGMLWGIQMSATGDHAMAPAHAHLNLVGFVLMGVFGAFYALAPSAAAGRLGMAHLALHSAAVVVLVPGIVMALTGSGETAAKIGSVLAVLSVALFLYQIIRTRTA